MAVIQIQTDGCLPNSSKENKPLENRNKFILKVINKCILKGKSREVASNILVIYIPTTYIILCT